jgi:hypothetical protein
MKRTAVILAHALVGWALCGAAMSVGLALGSVETALAVHAVAAPLFFGGIAFLYFRKFRYTGPCQTAGIFLGVVVVLDVFIVAMLIEKSFEMFTSVAGTWLPFALIFLSTWAVGVCVVRQG